MNDAISASLALAPLALAQAPAIGATEIGQWLLVAAAIAVIANQGMAFFRNLTSQFTKKPSSDSYTSQMECEKKHAAIASQLDTFSTDAETRNEKLRLELKGDVQGIHKRIDDVLKGMSRLEGKTS